MQITAVRSRVIALPSKKRVINRSGVFETMWDVLVDVETDQASPARPTRPRQRSGSTEFRSGGRKLR
jgi:hypothetical protein